MGHTAIAVAHASIVAAAILCRCVAVNRTSVMCAIVWIILLSGYYLLNETVHT